jgi:diguanylate cyclase
MKLLLVEDDQVDLMATKRLLKKSKSEFEITEVDSGKDAIKAMQVDEFDLVLMDYKLPDMNGLEILKQLQINGLGQTAIIFLSGVENEALAVECLESGAQDFILKSEMNSSHLHKAITHSKLRHENEQKLDTNRRAMQDLTELDQLTGLLNRYAFEVRIDQTKAIRSRQQIEVSLMLLDLDNFKWINDTHGHLLGDQVLIEVAKRLTKVCREEDFLCRLGGDEFSIALMYNDKEQSFFVAERIFEALKKPIVLQGTEINLACSIGIADFTDSHDELNDVLKKADLAMYRAKSDGKNRFHYFSDTLQETAERRILVESELRSAIKNQELVVFYQPQICTRTRTLKGVEALVRWQHPARGILGPNEFLDIAEETGLIEEIDHLVIDEACKQRVKWRDDFIKNDFKVAINLSARHLKNDNIINYMKKALQELKISPHLIELEIVESELVQDFAKAITVISKLKNLGIEIAIDDFGTGYSSLSYLKHLNVHTLKVDRSFILDVPRSKADCRLMKGLINLGKSMELQVVVEGVEDIGQLEKCEEYFADIVQGYFFSKPLQADDFQKYYANYLQQARA